MGCTASRLDANGMSLPAKVRPFFLPRFTPANRPLKGSTPSKKELLTHEKDEDGNSNHHFSNPLKSAPTTLVDSQCRSAEPEETKVKRDEKTNKDSNKECSVATNISNQKDMMHEMAKEGSPRGKGKNDLQDSTIGGAEEKEEAKMVDAFTETDMEDEDDDDNDDERMIGHGDFPGSPSFRVYFKDNEENNHKDIGKNDTLQSKVSSDDAVLTTESLPMKKNVIKKERKRRSFKKVLPKGWNVKSCYTSSHTTAKTAT